ncbi:MAG: hypothetical protein RLZ37_1742 [Actinomycetota bacterium]
MSGKKNFSLVFICVSTPIVIAVVMMIVGIRWFPAGDMAQAELHMRGFFERPPLVGAAGRIVSDNGFQGSHPGPSLWLAMLPVYLIGGRSSDALMAAAASVHLVSIAAVILLARRRGGWTFAGVSALSVLAVVRSSGTDFMIEPWNPWLALLPFAAFVFLVLEVLVPSPSDDVSAAIRAGRLDSMFLACAVAVGSHCVQSHAGYALLVVPPIGVMLVALTIRRMRNRDSIGVRFSPRVFTPLFVGVVTALVMWSPALLDQMRRRPGNLSILWQHFVSPEEPTLAFHESVEIIMVQMNLFGPWLFGPGAARSELVRWIGFIAFIAVVCAGFFAAKSAHTMPRSRAVFSILIGFHVLGSISILRIFGPYYEYTVRWFWLLTAITLAFGLFTAFSAIAPSVRLKIRSFAAPSTLVGFILLVLSCISVIQVVDRVKLPGRTDSKILAGLVDDVSRGIDKDKTYQIRFYDPYTLNATGFGLLLELERRGFTVKVAPEFAAAALPHRTAPMEQTDEVLWVVVGPALEEARSDPVLTVLATFNPRTPQQETRAKDLLNQVEGGLREAGREDLVSSLDSPGASILFAQPPLPEETAELVRELIGMGQPTGVFSMAVDDVTLSLR